MKFKRLKALYDADAGVHYDGKLCEIISINELKKTAQVAEVDQMFPPVVEVKVEELE
ncbi:MAG TPA: hypothetical protein K8V23_02945 [Lactobacillus crispatus]|uniref:Uncharacterized protein n=1 Tax=Lactobacillus crispatus TaxID=47770 RepID=A0A921K525_9LACO|nr:hypothetical protein [Lactobacillus crispatus]